MQLKTPSSPHAHMPASVSTVMLRVVYALIPGLIAYVWFFGWGVVINILFAIAVALGCEAAILAVRDKPLKPFLTDGSALVTAVLLAISIPPLSPWWITLIGTAFAIIVAKQLYGGLGYNTFNPAMVGYVLLLISFPVEMTSWQAPLMLITQHSLGFLDTLHIIFGGGLPDGLRLDALTTATPLDTLKTQIKLDHSVDDIISAAPIFGHFGGKGGEWISVGFMLGGLWLLYKRVINWHIPVAMIGGLLGMALIFFIINPASYPSPLFHLFSGATLLGAFFIATDPVTAPASTRGRLLYGALIGVLVYVIRTWGGYPDAVAFAVLLMNLATPTIDYYIHSRVFGHGAKRKD
ncbi:MAG: electron transport complex subunit RsxD [Gammaproteobacteria bacterium]|nr:electron transport complex subunit RsxD [Gammaproteobacteria bacterium]